MSTKNEKPKPSPLLKKLRAQIGLLIERSEARIDRAIAANSGQTISLNFKVTVDKSNTHPKVFTDLSFLETGYEDNGETAINLKQLLKVRRKVSLGVGGEAEDPAQPELSKPDGKGGEKAVKPKKRKGRKAKTEDESESGTASNRAETGQGEAGEGEPSQDSGKRKRRGKSKAEANGDVQAEAAKINLN